MIYLHRQDCTQPGSLSKIDQSMCNKIMVDSHTCVLIISSSSPEISDFLRLEIASLKGRASKWRGGYLQDRKRRSVAGERLCDSRYCGNQGRQRQLRIGSGLWNRRRQYDWCQYNEWEKWIGHCKGWSARSIGVIHLLTNRCSSYWANMSTFTGFYGI